MNKKKPFVAYDDDGYALCAKYKPEEYDLVELVSLEGKVKNGWWNGRRWDGLRIKSKEEFYKWKSIS